MHFFPTQQLTPTWPQQNTHVNFKLVYTILIYLEYDYLSTHLVERTKGIKYKNDLGATNMRRYLHGPTSDLV